MWLLPYSWVAERGRPILAVSILWLEPLSFLGTTITAPPQYFYVWDVLKGNNRSVISFTQLAPHVERLEDMTGSRVTIPWPLPPFQQPLQSQMPLLEFN